VYVGYLNGHSSFILIATTYPLCSNPPDTKWGWLLRWGMTERRGGGQEEQTRCLAYAKWRAVALLLSGLCELC